MSKAQRITVGLAALLMGTALAACSGGGAIATVNGQPISRSTFDNRLESSPMARNVLQQLVQETLIEQYAKNNNINVTDAELDARETQIKANFPSGSWDEMLKARGLTEADVRSALREQLIIDKALAKEVKITPAQIEDYFKKNHATFDKPEQVTARHILVPSLALAQPDRSRLEGGSELRGPRQEVLNRSRQQGQGRRSRHPSAADRWCRRSISTRSRRRSARSARRSSRRSVITSFKSNRARRDRRRRSPARRRRSPIRCASSKRRR